MDIVELGELTKAARDLKIRFMFDMDGTLVDTRQAVKEAYNAAGACPPEDFFGRPWREWLTDEDTHDRKNRIYPTKLAQYGRALPALELFMVLPNPGILTGASETACRAVSYKFGFPLGFCGCEMSLDDKILLLNALPAGIMFDDSSKAVEQIRRKTRWTVFNVHW